MATPTLSPPEGFRSSCLGWGWERCHGKSPTAMTGLFLVPNHWSLRFSQTLVTVGDRERERGRVLGTKIKTSGMTCKTPD